MRFTKENTKNQLVAMEYCGSDMYTPEYSSEFDRICDGRYNKYAELCEGRGYDWALTY